ncbi:MAG: PfkB family carbohydrate kinase [Candidatus Helarchaeota archaeon]
MLIIGHLCIDEKIIDGKRKRLELGSSVAYASITSVKNNYFNGLKTNVVSKIGYDFPIKFLRILKKNKVPIDFIIRADCKSTRYELNYIKEERTSLKLSNVCEKITKNDIPIKLIEKSKIIYFALIANEVELDIFKWLKTNFPDKLICLDIQGILRFKRPDNTIFLDKNDDILNSLSYIDILKMADYEAKVLIDSDNFKHVIKECSKYGPKIVIITSGYKGSLIYDAEKEIYYEIPAIIPKKVVDVTGTGDTYFSSFLSEFYKTKDIKHSGIYAATFVSYLVQKEGLNGMPRRNQVIKKLKVLKINN